MEQSRIKLKKHTLIKTYSFEMVIFYYASYDWVQSNPKKNFVSKWDQIRT